MKAHRVQTEGKKMNPIAVLLLETALDMKPGAQRERTVKFIRENLLFAKETK